MHSIRKRLRSKVHQVRVAAVAVVAAGELLPRQRGREEQRFRLLQLLLQQVEEPLRGEEAAGEPVLLQLRKRCPPSAPRLTPP